MWLADGRWRQWESFSCVNVDSVHNDGERHIPYLMLLGPEGTKSKMRAWAAGATKATPRERRSRSLFTRTVDGASMTM